MKLTDRRDVREFDLVVLIHSLNHYPNKVFSVPETGFDVEDWMVSKNGMISFWEVGEDIVPTLYNNNYKNLEITYKIEKIWKLESRQIGQRP